MSILEEQPVEGAGSLLCTASEVAKLLKISLRALWRLRSARKIPQPLRIGGAVRWQLDEIKKWIADGCPIPQTRENNPGRA